MSTPPPTLSRQIEKLTLSARNGCVQFDMWELLTHWWSSVPHSEREGLARPVSVLLSASWTHGHQSLFQVMTEHKDATHFKSIVIAARQFPTSFRHSNPSTVAAAVESDTEWLQAEAKALESLQVFRDKAFAHLDKELIKQPSKFAESLGGIETADARRVLGEAFERLNRYHRYITGIAHTRELLNQQHNFKWLVDVLDRGLEGFKSDKQDYLNSIKRGTRPRLERNANNEPSDRATSSEQR